MGKKQTTRETKKRVFVALPSKLLQHGEGPLDEYRQFVSLLREIGCDVKCPLEEVNWSQRKPKRPDITIRHRLKDLQTCDHLVALPVVKDHKSTGVMGYTFFAAAKEIPTSVYLRGSNDLDVPWQLVGLRDSQESVSVHFYQSNLLSGFNEVAKSIVGSLNEVEHQPTDASDEASPFGPEYDGYWRHRRQLFSQWDDGIRFDEVGLCSIKPENIANEIAKQLLGECVLDAFAGLGGSAIAFARQGKSVISFDTSAERIEMARHNAAVCGVADNIEFIHGDVFHEWKAVRDKVDSIYLDPSWGGPFYTRLKTFGFLDFETDGNGDVRSLIASFYNLHKHVAISLPKNFDTRELTDLHGDLLGFEDGKDHDEGGIQLSWHTRKTKVLFMTAFL